MATALTETRLDGVPLFARGNPAGSGWKDHTGTGAVCEVQLPDGLKESSRLDQPIFAPATKAETGHDENISFEQICEVVDRGLASRLRDLTLEIYDAARRDESADEW